MGSTGTDRFSDYPGTRGDQGGSSGVGGSSGEEQCDRAFATALEEVERCAFFQQYKDVPHRGTSVSIKLGQRIIVVESNTNETIGYLPTQFNYLAGCINSGFSYTGIVSSASKSPFATVHVDIGAIKP